MLDGTAAGFRMALLSANPLRGSGAVRLQYSLSEPSQVRIGAFNLRGQPVGTAVDEIQETGVYTTEISLGDRSRVATGIYFLRVDTVGRETGARVIRTTKIVVLQ